MGIANPAQSFGPSNTLFEQFLPAKVPQSAVWTRNALAILAGSILLTMSAKLSIPFFPVPVTLQTLVVLCLGMVLGPRLGAAAVIAYLAQGAAGLPVFAGTPEKGIGLAYMLGTTGGYLVGFVVAAYTVGLLAERRWDRSKLTTIAAMIVGNAIIYAFGLVWLGSIVGWDKPILAWGMMPFLLGDLAKILIAAALLPAAWKFFKR
jgi:biotin transport system substrate-specific component